MLASLLAHHLTLSNPDRLKFVNQIICPIKTRVLQAKKSPTRGKPQSRPVGGQNRGASEPVRTNCKREHGIFRLYDIPGKGRKLELETRCVAHRQSGLGESMGANRNVPSEERWMCPQGARMANVRKIEGLGACLLALGGRTVVLVHNGAMQCYLECPSCSAREKLWVNCCVGNRKSAKGRCVFHVHVLFSMRP